MNRIGLCAIVFMLVTLCACQSNIGSDPTQAPALSARVHIEGKGTAAAYWQFAGQEVKLAGGEADGVADAVFSTTKPHATFSGDWKVTPTVSSNVVSGEVVYAPSVRQRAQSRGPQVGDVVATWVVTNAPRAEPVPQSPPPPPVAMDSSVPPPARSEDPCTEWAPATLAAPVYLVPSPPAKSASPASSECCPGGKCDLPAAAPLGAETSDCRQAYAPVCGPAFGPGTWTVASDSPRPADVTSHPWYRVTNCEPEVAPLQAAGEAAIALPVNFFTCTAKWIACLFGLE